MFKKSKLRVALVALSLTTAPIVVAVQDLDLPLRETLRPETTNGVPHVQIDVDPVSELSEELLRRVAMFPGVIRKLGLPLQAATAELKDEEFLEDIRNWSRGEDGEREQITEQRGVYKWWWQHHTGAWMITLRDGAKERPLLEDKNSIEIGEIANLVDALQTIRPAVIAGELDDQLAQLVKPNLKKTAGKPT